MGEYRIPAVYSDPQGTTRHLHLYPCSMIFGLLTCNSLHVTLHLSSFCVPVYVPSEGTSCNSWHHYQPLPCKSYSPELGGGNLWLLLGQGWRLETLHS